MAEEEIEIDFSEVPKYTAAPVYKTKGKRVRRSYPSESVYQKRKQWWLDRGFGEQAAKWAASWRLGEPKKTRRVTLTEKVAIDNAILTAGRRQYAIDYEMRRFNLTREKAIKKLDTRLRILDRDRKIEKGLVEPGISLDSPKIESNIFRDISP